MKLETFFEKFNELADTPNGVNKMRELVLRLATTGHLIPTEGSGWANVALSEIASARMGKTILKSELSDSGIPVYSAGRENTAWGFITTSDLTFHTGTIVVSARGTIGFPKIPAEQKFISTQTTIAITPISKEIDSGYFCLQLKTVDWDDLTAKTAIPMITVKQVHAIEVRYPHSLAEQKRIVAKVDELMALCDRLEAQQQEREQQHADLARASLARFAEAPTPENLQFIFHKSYDIPPADLRKSILTLAVQGKLVPQDPKDEPAVRLLERIDAAPKRAMRTRATDEGESEEPTEFEPLFKLPPGWEWAPFRRLPLHASVGLDRGKSMQGPDKAVGYFKMNNIRNSGGVDLSDLTRIDATPDEIEAFALADGDFLFNTRNSRELVGKTCVFRAPSSDPILNNNNILRVKFIEGFSPDFIDYWFRSPQGNAELEKLKSNTTNVCAIYQGKLSGFPCVIPPLAEQRRIVTKVNQLMALVDELETQLATSRATAANLLSALVGELTGTTPSGKVSASTSTGRRGRPKKS